MLTVTYYTLLIALTIISIGQTVAKSIPPLPSLMQYPTRGIVQAACAKTRGNGYRLTCCKVGSPCIALTFDDGPHPEFTPRLLDVLKQRNIQVTFFVLGERAIRHPEILQRAIAEGHEIGNHSWNHKILTKLDSTDLYHELLDTSEVIKKATGKKVSLMRPPYGVTHPLLSWLIEKEYGLKMIHWSVDPSDWKHPGLFEIMERFISGAKPGAIILSHDLYLTTIEAMPAALDALLARGYQFVTVSQLLSRSGKNAQRHQAKCSRPKKRIPK